MDSTVNGLFQFLLLHVAIKMKINRIFQSRYVKFGHADDDSDLFGKKDRNQQSIAEFFNHCRESESINRVDPN